MAKKSILGVRLTAAQHAVITQQATAAGKSITDYVQGIFARTVPGFALVEDLPRGGDKRSVEARLSPFMKEDGWYDEFAIATQVYQIPALDYRDIRFLDSKKDAADLSEWPLLLEAKRRNAAHYDQLADVDEERANQENLAQW